MTIFRHLVPAAGMLGLLSLAAYGGDGGGAGGGGATSSGLRLDPARAQSLTGSSPPAETVADVRARAAALLERSDSMVSSTVFGNSSDPDLRSFRLRARCFGTTCTWTEPRIGISETTSLRDLVVPSGPQRAVLSKNGVTMFEGAAAETEDQLGTRWYGGEMDHAVFQLEIDSETINGVRVDVRLGGVVGDLTGSAPGFTLTWRGLMAGTATAGAARDNLLQGDAVLTYTADGARGLLDAAFTNIRDLDRGAAHSTAALRFDDVPVAADGTFEAGLTGNRIQGGFYGPGHAETAGVVEQANIVGAFGAKRAP